MKKYSLAEELIAAQRQLLALHYQYDGKVPDSHLKRFDRVEKRVSALQEQWDLEICNLKDNEIQRN